MSSYDPDDTTPLINPSNGENAANHGTFPEDEDDAPLDAAPSVVSDDEMLDAPRTGLQRFNPFDRVPNLPPQLADELATGVVTEEPEGAWTRFKRWDIRGDPLSNADLSSPADSLALTVNRSQTTAIGC
jgi:hypothetical protein